VNFTLSVFQKNRVLTLFRKGPVPQLASMFGLPSLADKALRFEATKEEIPLFPCSPWDASNVREKISPALGMS